MVGGEARQKRVMPLSDRNLQRPGSARSYAVVCPPGPGGGRTLSVVKEKSEFGGNCEDEERIKV